MRLAVAVLAVLVTGSAAFGFPGGIPGLFGGIHGGGGFGGPGAFLKPFGGFGPGARRPVYRDPLQLSCNAAFTGYSDHGEGHTPVVVEAITVNIRPASGYGRSGGHGAFGAKGFNPLLSFGAFGHGGGFSHAPGGGDSGLEAEIEIFSRVGGEVSLIVTERSYTADGCVNDNFGPGLSTGEGGHGAPYGSSPALGGFHGFATPFQIFAGKGGVPGYGSQDYLPDGVIAETVLTPGVAKIISLGELGGFRNVKHLAGRGLIVCTKTDVDNYGVAECVGPILSCCSLSYDDQDRPSITSGPH